ncbi:cell wall-binding repeat-containing protein [Euzebya sp.]|uniref:cell wall-binding repeat-containing protein n=1 Tax=Euzebya sp. TaxID=1971409 RepID=UPI00351476FC
MAFILSMFWVPAGAQAGRSSIIGDDATSPADQAIAISRATFVAADEVVIARADVFADALASGGAQVGSRPLLATPGEALPASVAQEIRRLEASSIIILGGPDAVSEEIEQDLQALDVSVRRIAGPSRIETATALASELLPRATTAILVRAFGAGSQAYVDSIAAGSLAAHSSSPVIFTDTDELSAPTAEFLQSSEIEHVVIVGGTDSISTEVEKTLQSLDLDTTRLAGAERAGTATAIASHVGFNDATSALLVDGSDTPGAWLPAFAAAGFSAVRNVPVLLTTPGGLPAATEAYLSEHAFELVTCMPPVTVAACTSATGQDPVPHSTVDPEHALLVEATDAATAGEDLSLSEEERIQLSEATAVDHYRFLVDGTVVGLQVPAEAASRFSGQYEFGIPGVITCYPGYQPSPPSLAGNSDISPIDLLPDVDLTADTICVINPEVRQALNELLTAQVPLDEALRLVAASIPTQVDPDNVGGAFDAFESGSGGSGCITRDLTVSAYATAGFRVWDFTNVSSVCFNGSTFTSDRSESYPNVTTPGSLGSWEYDFGNENEENLDATVSHEQMGRFIQCIDVKVIPNVPLGQLCPRSSTAEVDFLYVSLSGVDTGYIWHAVGIVVPT